MPTEIIGGQTVEYETLPDGTSRRVVEQAADPVATESYVDPALSGTNARAYLSKSGTH